MISKTTKTPVFSSQQHILNLCKMELRNLWTSLFVVAACICQAQAFAPQSQCRSQTSLGIFDKIGQFFEELDAFVDDATSRRLGAGASFYGKRKSNFYGENDSGRKRDRNVFDPTGEFLRLSKFPGNGDALTDNGLLFFFFQTITQRTTADPLLPGCSSGYKMKMAKCNPFPE